MSKTFLLFIFLLCTAKTFAGIIPGYVPAQQSCLEDMRRQLEEIIKPLWRGKFAYWEQIPPEKPLNSYIPGEIKEKALRGVGLELGKISEILRYSERFNFSIDIASMRAEKVIKLWEGVISIPVSVRAYCQREDFARYAVAKAIDAGVPIGQKQAQMLFNGYPTKLSLGKPSFGIGVDVSEPTSTTVNILQGAKVPKRFGGSYFWGYLKQISARPTFCSESKQAKEYCPILYGDKYIQQKTGVYMLMMDYANLQCTQAKVTIYYAE
mgnify:CR=1 FL=1